MMNLHPVSVCSCSGPVRQLQLSVMACSSYPRLSQWLLSSWHHRSFHSNNKARPWSSRSCLSGCMAHTVVMGHSGNIHFSLNTLRSDILSEYYFKIFVVSSEGKICPILSFKVIGIYYYHLMGHTNTLLEEFIANWHYKRGTFCFYCAVKRVDPCQYHQTQRVTVDCCSVNIVRLSLLTVVLSILSNSKGHCWLLFCQYCQTQRVTVDCCSVNIVRLSLLTVVLSILSDSKGHCWLLFCQYCQTLTVDCCSVNIVRLKSHCWLLFCQYCQTQRVTVDRCSVSVMYQLRCSDRLSQHLTIPLGHTADSLCRSSHTGGHSGMWCHIVWLVVERNVSVPYAEGGSRRFPQSIATSQSTSMFKVTALGMFSIT